MSSVDIARQRDLMEQWLLAKWYYIWGIILGIGTLIFSAGVVVEKTKTERFVTKEVFAAYKETFDVKLDGIKEDLSEVKTALGIPPRIVLP
jgi:hypothetical protein